MNNEEFLDICNENDEVVGSRSRSDIHRDGLLHREVHVWVYGLNKEIFFQKRGTSKSSAGLLDASVGGHVDLGEDYLKAALRELKEETNIEAEENDLVFLKKIRLSSKDEKQNTTNNVYRSLYILKKPIAEHSLVKESDNKEIVLSFEKFLASELIDLESSRKLLFDKFILTHEINEVLDYLGAKSK